MMFSRLFQLATSLGIGRPVLVRSGVDPSFYFSCLLGVYLFVYLFYLLYRTILCMLALHSMWHIYCFHILVGLFCCDLFLIWVGVTRGKRPHTQAKRHIGTHRNRVAHVRYRM